jgi:hypothetical protein
MTDDAEWLEWRRRGITATEIADAVLGTYGGAYAVIARKLGKYEPEQNDQMARGHRWQPTIADAVHVLSGYYVVGEEHQAEHAEDPRWRATLDGLLAERPEVASVDECRAVFEAKTVGLGSRPNRERWALQMQWQMFVTGLPVALLAEAAIDDGDDRCLGVRLEWLEHDPLVQTELIATGEVLWQHLHAGTLPEPSAGSLAAVRAVHAVAVAGSDSVALDELEGDLERWLQLREIATDVGTELDMIEAHVIATIDTATKGATSGGWRVSYGEPARKLTRDAELELLEAHPEFGTTVLDRARVKEEAPELYERARTRCGARTLRITPPKGS